MTIRTARTAIGTQSLDQREVTGSDSTQIADPRRGSTK